MEVDALLRAMYNATTLRTCSCCWGVTPGGPVPRQPGGRTTAWPLAIESARRIAMVTGLLLSTQPRLPPSPLGSWTVPGAPADGVPGGARCGDAACPAGRFLALPHAAVLAWAQSDSLQVHSENGVVYLLSAWVKAQETAGAAAKSAEEQLVGTVRQLAPATSR
jgi:hypothetical protein